MDDLISRQAAIDAIDETNWYHQNENKDMVSGANSAEHQPWFKSDDVYSALKSVPSAPRWIPVTERLPKPIAPSQRREWFITSNTYGGVTVTCYEFEASPFKEGWQTDMTILAWMPLPESWKGEDDAEVH